MCMKPPRTEQWARWTGFCFSGLYLLLQKEYREQINQRGNCRFWQNRLMQFCWLPGYVPRTDYRCARYRAPGGFAHPFSPVSPESIAFCLCYDVKKAWKERVLGKCHVERAGVPVACRRCGCLSRSWGEALWGAGQERVIQVEDPLGCRPWDRPELSVLRGHQRTFEAEQSQVEAWCEMRLERVVRIQAFLTQSSWKFSLWISSAHLTWELVRNTESWPHPRSTKREFAF